MPSHPKVLLATTNPGKIREYRELLRGFPLDIVTLEDAAVFTAVDETGATIHENAVLKAREYAKMSGMLTIADDSGLEVDVLDGEPGVHSARYGGVSTEEERNELLLARLADVPETERSARFRCVIAVAFPDALAGTSHGTCEGVIAREPRGENGFGYDPIFHLPGLGLRMAELSQEHKNQISHRGQALSGALRTVREAVSR